MTGGKQSQLLLKPTKIELGVKYLVLILCLVSILKVELGADIVPAIKEESPSHMAINVAYFARLLLTSIKNN